MKKTFWIICLILCITGGGFLIYRAKNNSQLISVERTLMILLNAPDDSIAEMYKDVFEQADDNEIMDSEKATILIELQDNDARRILSNRFEDKVTENFINRCLAMDSIMIFQYMAAVNGISTHVKNITITEPTQNNQVRYEAVIQILEDGATTQEINVNGQVQLDNSGKIDAIVLNARGLDKLYQ